MQPYVPRMTAVQMYLKGVQMYLRGVQMYMYVYLSILDSCADVLERGTYDGLGRCSTVTCASLNLMWNQVII